MYSYFDIYLYINYKRNTNMDMTNENILNINMNTAIGTHMFN